MLLNFQKLAGHVSSPHITIQQYFEANTISALKVQVGKAGRLVGQHAVQLHGGMGVSNEMSIGHYLKRFTAIDSMFGNTQHHINKYQTK